MIFDFIIIAVILIFFLIGMHRGAAATVLNIVGLILSILIAGFAANYLADFIYAQFIREPFIQNLEQALTQSDISLTINSCIDELPGFLSSIINPVLLMFGLIPETFENSFQISEALTDNAVITLEKSLSPLVINALCIIFNLVLFLIILIIIKLVIKLILNLFDIPVIKQINKLMGGILGIAEGIIFVFVAVNICFAVFGTNNNLISDALATGFLFKIFCISI